MALAACSCGGPQRRADTGPEPGHTRLTAFGDVCEDPCPVQGGILFARRAPGRTFQIWVLPDSGPAPHEELISDDDLRAPAASAEGLLAFAANKGGTWDIFTTTPGAPTIAGTDADETGPTWAPDGKRLAWAAFDRRAAEWRLRIGDGSGEARELGAGFAPAWHPTEDRIACQRTRHGDRLWSVVIIDVASGRATEPWPEPGRGAITPSWSRDGQWIFFAARIESPEQDEPQFDGLWAVSADGAKRVRLTAANVESFSPRETSDGRIVYCRREGTAVELWSFKSPLARAEQPK